MARRRTQQPEDSKRPAAAADQDNQQQPGGADPKQMLLKFGDKEVTVLPKEDDGPDVIKEAAAGLKDAQAVFNIIDQMTLAAQPILDNEAAIKKAMQPRAFNAALNMAAEMQGNLLKLTRAFSGMQGYLVSEKWDEFRRRLERVNAVTQELSELSPYLERELKKPKYEGKTIEDLINTADADNDGIPTAESLFMSALAAARTARDAAEERKLLQQVTYKNSTEIKTVTDKFAGLFFSLAAPSPQEIDGQRAFIPVSYEKAGAKKEITLLYDFSFNENVIKQFGLSRKFDDQAFFVAAVVDNLLDEGNRLVSLSKIWHELGNEGSPSTDDLSKLLDILRLGGSTMLTADVSQVIDAWNDKDDGLERDLFTPVIPVQIIGEKFVATGKIANALINITGHTPFYLIAYHLNHYTTWDKRILRGYKGRRTKRFYSVLRFLVTQIGWMRNANSKRGNKILYESLYAHTGDRGTRAQQLSRDMMYRLLDEAFIPTGYIKSYKEDEHGKKGVKLTYSKQPKIAQKK